MTDLRSLARGRDCQIRLPNGICNHDNATTVLAHLRLTGVSGMGLKAPDIFGAWACSACHQYCDVHHDYATSLWFAQGVFRTINQLVKEGVVRWD